VQLSNHFTLEELTRSETAARRGLDNTPDAETIENLKLLAAGLEEIRELLGKPMQITSGYRSLKVNSAVGSKPTSAHVKGFAADFICPEYGSVSDVCRAIRDSGIAYDQLIHEFGSWVHVSFSPELRHMALTIDQSGTRQGIA
jgi:uncharacterized protein YcbK (DUF882 family)